jgi:hypothetical protein
MTTTNTNTAWSVSLDLTVTFADAPLLSANDAHLKREAGYDGTLWLGMMNTTDAPLPIRVRFARTGPTTLKPVGYSLLMTGSEAPKRDTPWPVGGISLSGRSRGIPTNACVQLVLRNEVSSHDNRFAKDDIGTASIPLQQIISITSATPYHIDAPIVLRATQEPSICALRATITDAKFDRAHLREVYDAAMQPHVQAAIMQTHASLGWLHMVRNDADTGELVNPVALKGLTEVASKSIVPYVNDEVGVLPVDFFFDVTNPRHHPEIPETRWLKIAEHAFWMRGMSLEQVSCLLQTNLDAEKHYEPRFEAVISGFAKMFVLTANAMPYRSDELRARNEINQLIRAGTDDFRSALTQLCGDCEDLAKTAYEMFTLFSRASFESPLLKDLQRLSSCYFQTGGLFDVTSAKLEQTGIDGKQHRFVPLTERKCGLHAATFLYPKSQFKAELSRTTSCEEAAQLNLNGDSVVPDTQIPRIADQVGMIVLEGTGSMDARMLNHRDYVTRAAKSLGTVEAMKEAEQLATAEELRLLLTRKVYVENVRALSPFGFKPEMAQFAEYKYDYEKLFSGDLMPMSQFYVAPVECYTTVPLKAGQRYARFAYVTQDPANPRKGEWLKTAMFDAVVCADERVALMPQPPISESVYKCAQMMTQRMEPVPFIDSHVDEAGPDALLIKAEQIFSPAKDASTPEGLVRVDLLLFNRNIEAQELATHLPQLKAHLESLPYVKAMCYRNMDLNAGLVTGVLRIFVEPKSALQYKPSAEKQLFELPPSEDTGASVHGEAKRQQSQKFSSFEEVLYSVSLTRLRITGADTVLCPDNESMLLPLHEKIAEDDAAQLIRYFLVSGSRLTKETFHSFDGTRAWRFLGEHDSKAILGHYSDNGTLYEKWSVTTTLRKRDPRKAVLLGVHLEWADYHNERASLRPPQIKAFEQ